MRVLISHRDGVYCVATQIVGEWFVWKFRAEDLDTVLLSMCDMAWKNDFPNFTLEHAAWLTRDARRIVQGQQAWLPWH